MTAPQICDYLTWSIAKRLSRTSSFHRIKVFAPPSFFLWHPSFNIIFPFSQSSQSSYQGYLSEAHQKENMLRPGLGGWKERRTLAASYGKLNFHDGQYRESVYCTITHGWGSRFHQDIYFDRISTPAYKPSCALAVSRCPCTRAFILSSRLQQLSSLRLSSG